MQKQRWAAGGSTLALVVGVAAWWLSRPAPEPLRQAALLATPAGSEQAGGSAPSSASARQDEPAARPSAGAAPPGVPPSSATVAARRAERQRADAIRRHLAEQSTRASAGGAAAAAPADPTAARPPLSEAEAERRKGYLRRALQEQYIPVARSCYQELLDRQPQAQGKVVLAFSIVGDAEADAGGVVDEVELHDDSTMEDAEFLQCMRESLYSTVFEPPPRGASKTTVVYPLELHP